MLAALSVAVYGDADEKNWVQLVLSEDEQEARLCADGKVWHLPASWKSIQPQAYLKSALTKGDTTLQRIISVVTNMTGRALLFHDVCTYMDKLQKRAS